MRFPILRLPLVSLNVVIEYLDVGDIYVITQCSQRSLRTIRCLRLPYDTKITINKNSKISIEHPKCTTTFEFPLDGLSETFSREFVDDLVVIRTPFKPLELIKSVIAVFRSSSIKELTIDSDFNFNLMEFIDAMEFSGHALRIAKLLITDGIELNQNDLSTLLKTTMPYEVLDIACPITKDFKCDLPKALRVLEIKSGKWIGRSELMNLNYAFVRIGNNQLSMMDIGNYIERCIKNELPAVQFMTIRLAHKTYSPTYRADVRQSFMEIDQHVSLEKHETTLTNLQQRDKDFGPFYINGLFEYDGGDGRKVTVGVEYSLCTSVQIYVWKME